MIATFQAVYLLCRSRFDRTSNVKRNGLISLDSRLRGNDGDRSSEYGFTLIELLVYIILTVMFSMLVFSFLLDFWGSAATLENDSETFVTRQNAGDKLRDRLNAAAHLIEQNSISDSHVLAGTSPSWNKIHATPGTTVMPTSNNYTPVIYYEAPSIDSSKNYIMNGAQPYDDEFVLYMNGSTKQLLLRSLANPSASGNTVTTSCPASLATTSCPADTVIADDVTSIDTRYFSRSGNTIDYTSITDPLTGAYIGPDFPSVEVVELTLHLGRNKTLHGGAATVNETIIRVALRNQ